MKRVALLALILAPAAPASVPDVDFHFPQVTGVAVNPPAAIENGLEADKAEDMSQRYEQRRRENLQREANSDEFARQSRSINKNEDEKLLDEWGRSIRPQATEPQAGTLIDKYGRTLDVWGRPLDRAGNPLPREAVPYGNDGPFIDKHGRLLDEYGRPIEPQK